MSVCKSLLKESVLDLKKVLNNVKNFSKRPKMLQAMLKKVSVVWAQDDDDRRVVALLIIMKTLHLNPDFFNTCSRGMYMVYVKNCKFIYGNSIGKNIFMKNGLLEVYSLQLGEAYKHAFVFIRQLAITVRKAFLHSNKEEIRTVYNWQFVYSLKFWCEFVARNASSSELIKSLIHPLNQVILGTVRLNPGSRWIPLRFHCVECLHLLVGADKSLRCLGDEKIPEEQSPAIPSPVLVPSLPLLLDVFQLFDFNRRASSASNAPMDLRLMLHFSPSQRKETACMDAVASWLHDLIVEALSLYAGSVAFPEYASPAVTEIRTFLKSCRVANFTRNFRSLLTKVKEQSALVEKRRAVIKTITDTNAIANLEAVLGQSTSPLLAYYVMHRRERVRELSILTERFKNQEEEHMRADDDDEYEDRFGDKKKKDKSSKDSENRSKKQKRARDDDEEDESDAESDASYDIDDGTTVTHVCRSDKNKQKDEGDEEEDDDDFDLDAALQEDDEEDEEVDGGGDELKEFRLDDFENDDDDDCETRAKLVREDPDLGAASSEDEEMEAPDDGVDSWTGSDSEGDERELANPPPTLSSKVIQLDSVKQQQSKKAKNAVKKNLAMEKEIKRLQAHQQVDLDSDTDMVDMEKKDHRESSTSKGQGKNGGKKRFEKNKKNQNNGNR